MSIFGKCNMQKQHVSTCCMPHNLVAIDWDTFLLLQDIASKFWHAYNIIITPIANRLENIKALTCSEAVL